MKFKSQFDVIVLGNHPSALLAGCLAAQKELSVLIISPQDQPEFFKTSHGQYFDPDPNWILGLDSKTQGAGLLYELLTQIQDPSAESDFSSLVFHSGISISTPEIRMNLRSLENLQVEFKRELTAEERKSWGVSEVVHNLRAQMLQFWAKYPGLLDAPESKTILERVFHLLSRNSYNYFEKEWDRVFYSRREKFEQKSKAVFPKDTPWLNRHLRLKDVDTRLNQLWSALWYGLSAQAISETSFFDLFHLLCLVDSGASIEGGIARFRSFLLESAGKLGVQISREPCQRIYIKNNTLMGVQIEGSGEMIQAKVGGVLGRAAHKALPLTHPVWSDVKNLSLPSGWRFTLALTVRSEAIPEGLCSRLIWQDKGSPVLEIEIVRGSTYDEKRSKDQSIILYVRTILPYDQTSLTMETQKILAMRMFAQAKNIFPFLEDHILNCFPDVRSESLGSDLSRVYLFGNLESIPDHLLVYSSRVPRVNGYLGIKNVFAASPEVYPQLGSFGIAVSALEATDALVKLSRNHENIRI